MAKIGKEDENMVEQKDVMILAIESSCDETAASVVKNGREVLSNVISSQIELHKLYGGVVPEIASRKHIEKINQVIEEALSEAKVACGGASCRCGRSEGDCLRKKSSTCGCAPYRRTYFSKLH